MLLIFAVCGLEAFLTIHVQFRYLCSYLPCPALSISMHAGNLILLAAQSSSVSQIVRLLVTIMKLLLFFSFLSHNLLVWFCSFVDLLWIIFWFIFRLADIE